MNCRKLDMDLYKLKVIQIMVFCTFCSIRVARQSINQLLPWSVLVCMSLPTSCYQRTCTFYHLHKLQVCLCTHSLYVLRPGPPFTTMTSSNGNIFRVTGPLCGKFTGPGEFPTQRPVTRRFDVFFDLRLNKRLSKQPWGWWFETLSWSLWRHCNA